MLDVKLGNQLIANIELKDDNLVWTYTKNWQDNGYAISPHLQLNNQIPSINVKRFLQNLLPEGNALDELVATFNLSRHNTFGIIKKIGFDLSGALTIFPSDQIAPSTGKLRIISNQELSRRLSDREHYSLIVWDGIPRLSVAGIQDKINVIVCDNGKVAFGEGNICSTHILKFEKQKLAHLALNEYITLQLADFVGLNVAKAELKYFGNHSALLVTRFDRELTSPNTVKRTQIIDGCQMLNLPPEYKYERNFGSGRDVAHIREGVSLPKLFTLADFCANPTITKKSILNWALFNLLVNNFDAHGKNISFFISKNNIMLTPFYDLVNIKMYSEFDQDLAMAFGDEFDSNNIHAYQLADFADSCLLPRPLVKKQLTILISKIKQGLAIDFENIIKTSTEKKYISKYKSLVKAKCQHLEQQIKYIVNIEL